MSQTLMHRQDDVPIEEALKTTNLCLKSIVGHEKQGYNATLGTVKDTNNTIQIITANNRQLNNIVKNLNKASELLIQLEIKCFYIYKGIGLAQQICDAYNRGYLIVT